MSRVFSGIQPSGELHLGNYLGAVKNWVRLQHEGETIICIVDYHAITSKYEPAQLRERRRAMAIGLLSAGIDPGVTSLYAQSQIPEHTELAWLLNTITPLGELERQTQYKERVQRLGAGGINAGILNYPVLQAADILLFRADRVPVGEDQVQHLELSRVIARRWNAAFGRPTGRTTEDGADEREAFFPEPEPLLTPTRRIMGLDGQAKMSKTMGNTIGLLESTEAAWEKLRTAATDPKRIRRTDPGTPEVCNVYHLHRGFSSPDVVEHVAVQCRSAGWGCLDCKKALAESMERELAPIRRRAAELEADPRPVDDALEAGAARCRVIARETMDGARDRMGF